MNHVHGTYDFALVVFSYVVAVMASYTVLDLVGWVSKTFGRKRLLWLLFGSIAMSMGVWSMHFIGMLAFSLQVPVSYNLFIIFESYVAILIGSFLSLFIVGRDQLTLRHLFSGGILLAAGIVAMHYTGMEAMQIGISYNLMYVGLSIVIAIIAAVAAFWLSFYFRKTNEKGKVWKKLSSGLVMGAAVVGMHYTGMFSAEFYIDERYNSTVGKVLDQKLLGYVIVVATFITLGLSIFGTYISKRFAIMDHEIQTGSIWYKSLFDKNKDGIIAVNFDYQITGFNPAMIKLLGLKDAKLLKHSIYEILPFIVKEDRGQAIDGLQSALSGEPKSYDISMVRDNKERIDVHCMNVPVVVDGQVVGSYIISRDITEEKLYKNKIQQQAYHDDLTGLPNRRMFNKLLSDKIESNPNQFAVMMMDIDRFKIINDTLGHAYGDQLLQEVGKRIEKQISGKDVIAARLGGDEFTLLCNEKYSYNELSELAKGIIRVISHPYHLKDSDFYVTASVGIALYPEDGLDMIQLLKNADSAMYEVKKGGKNGFQFYSHELNSQMEEKIKLEADLRKALSFNEFFLHYQPQVCSENNRLIGVEALVRWQHPTRGIVAPNIFIPIAEETGIIYELGNWVLREACRQMKEWQMAGGAFIPISVNLSAQQFYQANLGQYILSILEETGLEPKYLKLEITESMMMDSNLSNQILKELSEFGIQLSLDDFGTGYSSLSYLKMLPINQLKIDRSFIKDLTNNPNDKAIVATIVSMAKHLQMDVIAEGIEEKEQLDILKENNCFNIQGYYYSKPLPANEFEIAFLST